MKRFIWLLHFMVVMSSASAQNMFDFYQSEEVVWYGIDFSQARFINFGDDFTAAEVKKIMLEHWDLDPLTTEYEKLLRKRFHKKVIETDLAVSGKRNNAANYTDKIVNEGYDMDIARIKEIVTEYKIQDKGYGLLFIVEGFEKVTDYAYIWIVFIDNENKEVIGVTRSLCRAFIGDIEDRWLGAINYALEHGGNYLKSYK